MRVPQRPMVESTVHRLRGVRRVSIVTDGRAACRPAPRASDDARGLRQRLDRMRRRDLALGELEVLELPVE